MFSEKPLGVVMSGLRTVRATYLVATECGGEQRERLGHLRCEDDGGEDVGHGEGVGE